MVNMILKQQSFVVLDQEFKSQSSSDFGNLLNWCGTNILGHTNLDHHVSLNKIIKNDIVPISSYMF